MVNLKSVASILAAALVLTPAVAQETFKCAAATTQLQMNQCAGAELAAADAEMNQLYRQQMAYVDAERRKRLQASQRAWLKYRDSACLYETGPRAQAGSMWPMQTALCQAKLTRQRNELLKAYVACRQDGCR